MHEFLLVGQVASDNEHKLQQQLAGVTRMQPQHVLERHLVFKGKPPPGLDYLPSGGGSQGVLAPELQRTRTMVTGQLYYVQLVCDLERLRAAKAAVMSGDKMINGNVMDEGPSKNGDVDGSAETVPDVWTLEFRDTPEPGKQPVTTRLLIKSPIDGGDIIEFAEALGFE
jgi:mediator of RNA polymerase II transcription subunit 18